MLKTSVVCSEGLIHLKEHMRVVKFYGHKSYCKLKVYESRYKHRAKISTEKQPISSLISFYVILVKIIEKYLSRKFIFEVRNLQFYKTEPFCRYSYTGANQWTGFYMITASVMKGLINENKLIIKKITDIVIQSCF